MTRWRTSKEASLQQNRAEQTRDKISRSDKLGAYTYGQSQQKLTELYSSAVFEFPPVCLTHNDCVTHTISTDRRLIISRASAHVPFSSIVRVTYSLFHRLCGSRCVSNQLGFNYTWLEVTALWRLPGRHGWLGWGWRWNGAWRLWAGVGQEGRSWNPTAG